MDFPLLYMDLESLWVSVVSVREDPNLQVHV